LSRESVETRGKLWPRESGGVLKGKKGPAESGETKMKRREWDETVRKRRGRGNWGKTKRESREWDEKGRENRRENGNCEEKNSKLRE